MMEKERKNYSEILLLQEKVDSELEKGEAADMNLIDSFFAQIRDLSGYVDKTEEEKEKELKRICKR